jgi:hypothetical protein
MPRPLRLAAPFAFVILMACEARTQPEPAPPPPPPAQDRPQVITDTLVIEGMPEPSTAELLTSPGDAAVPFSTYVPAGIAASFEGTGDTLAVRFTAAFTGSSDPNAYMHVRFYAPGVSRDQAREMVGAFLTTRLPDDDPVTGQLRDAPYETIDPPAWAHDAFSLQYRGDGNLYYFGRVILASRNGRIFHVLTHYPAEYGDGLTPLLARILEHWRWEDTGEFLIGAGPPAGR